MPERLDVRNQKFTDIMIAVESLDGAESVWNGVMGLERVAEGQGWRMLQDPDTKQRLVITSEPFGAEWAIAFAAKDLDTTLNALGLARAVVQRQDTSAVGFQYALARTFAGQPILVYVE